MLIILLENETFEVFCPALGKNWRCAGQRASHAIPCAWPHGPVLWRNVSISRLSPRAAQTCEWEDATQIGVLIILLRLDCSMDTAPVVRTVLLSFSFTFYNGRIFFLNNNWACQLAWNLTFTQESTLLHRICVITEFILFKIRECLSREDYKGSGEWWVQLSTQGKDERREPRNEIFVPRYPIAPGNVRTCLWRAGFWWSFSWHVCRGPWKLWVPAGCMASLSDNSKAGHLCKGSFSHFST